jgi:hypothetical protein
LLTADGVVSGSSPTGLNCGDTDSEPSESCEKDNPMITAPSSAASVLGKSASPYTLICAEAHAATIECVKATKVRKNLTLWRLVKLSIQLSFYPQIDSLFSCKLKR